MKTEQRRFENKVTGIVFDELGNLVKLKGVIRKPSSLIIGEFE